MKPLTIHIEALAASSPLAHDWASFRAQFAGDASADAAEDWQPKPNCLAPRAAKRLSPQIRLALTMAEQVALRLPEDAGWVFASSIGEGETLQVILEALRTPEMMIQPLRFQNAVHNAASGQWTIAAGLNGPTTSIGAYAETVGAGFLKAAMQVTLERRAVGLVLFDVPLPEPLDAVHPLGLPFGAAFALTPDPSPATIATLEITAGQGALTPPQSDIAKQLIDTLNPVAAVTPLLERLAGLGDGPVTLGLHGGSALTLSVTPK